MASETPPTTSVARLARLGAGVAGAILVTACCGRGCGFREGEKSYEQHRGSVNATLVRKTTYKGGGTKVPLPLSTSDFVVRVETTPPFDEPVPCEKVVFADDGKGKHLAFRCEDEASWTVLRLRGGDVRLRECDAPIGTSDPKKPDFSKLTSLSAAATRLDTCKTSPALITKSIVADEGEAAALPVVDAWATAGRDDAWASGARALPDAGTETAFASLCESLLPTARSVGLPRYLVGVGRCKLDDPRIGEAALTRLRAMLGEIAQAGYPADSGPQAGTLRWLIAISLRHRPGETGALACGALATPPGKTFDGDISTALLTAIGRTKTRCDKLGPLLSTPPCGSDVECGNELCDATALAKDSDDWAIPTFSERSPLGASPRTRPSEPRSGRALLFALRVNGPLPRAVTLAFARRRYPVTPAPSGAPACTRGTPPSVPCVCDSDLKGSFAICNVDPVTQRAEHGRCNFHVDDVKKRVDDVRAMCRPEGAGCDADIDDCCLGFVCRPDGNVGRKCLRDEGDGSGGAGPASSASAAPAPSASSAP